MEINSSQIRGLVGNAGIDLTNEAAPSSSHLFVKVPGQSAGLISTKDLIHSFPESPSSSTWLSTYNIKTFFQIFAPSQMATGANSFSSNNLLSEIKINPALLQNFNADELLRQAFSSNQSFRFSNVFLQSIAPLTSAELAQTNPLSGASAGAGLPPWQSSSSTNLFSSESKKLSIQQDKTLYSKGDEELNSQSEARRAPRSRSLELKPNNSSGILKSLADLAKRILKTILG